MCGIRLLFEAVQNHLFFKGKAGSKLTWGQTGEQLSSGAIIARNSVVWELPAGLENKKIIVTAYSLPQ